MHGPMNCVLHYDTYWRPICPVHVTKILGVTVSITLSMYEHVAKCLRPPYTQSPQHDSSSFQIIFKPAVVAKLVYICWKLLVGLYNG